MVLLSHRLKQTSCLLLTGLIASAGQAHAQSQISYHLRDANKASFSRVPADLAPRAIERDGFMVLPKLKLETLYVDNVYYTENNTQNDTVIQTTPQIEITKAYGDHTMRLSAQAKDQRYMELSGENNTTYDARLQLNLQATKGLAIPTEIKAARNTISRAAPGQARFTTEPLYQDTYSLSTGLDYRFNRLNLKLIGRYEHADYQDGVSTLTAAPIIFSSKDRDTSSLSLIGTYALQPSESGPPALAVYSGITTSRQRFDRFNDSNGNDTSGLRSNKGLNILAGLKANYKNLIIGDIGGGYFWRDYDDSRADSVEGFDIASNLAYIATPKLTLNFEADREVNQDTDLVQGYIKSQYLLGAEYEFQHNFYGITHVTYENADFIDNPREDDTYAALLGLRYIHSPHLESRLSITQESRDSTATGSDYDQYIVRFGLTGSL